MMVSFDIIASIDRHTDHHVVALQILKSLL